MKKIKLFERITVCTFVLLLAIPFTARSEQIEGSITAQSSEEVFKPEELEQMLAPIALYPDPLLAQVLTAATYPLEVVAADRFAKENQGLTREVLLVAAKDKDWEPSVKAMLEFPDVLAMMDDQLEWTGKLGDAFLAQQSDCMDAVQRLRQKAYAQGNLATTGKQMIRVEPQTQIIIIEPASPEVIYVPVYDTAVIYGQWWYPAYPPYYFFPERYSGISFFSGVFVTAFWGSWGAWDCNWHSRYVTVNLDRYNKFTNTHYGQSSHYQFYKAGQDNQPWRYDARHRPNARPADRVAVQRFSVQQVTSPAARPAAPDLRKHDQATVISSTINSRENVRPTINTSQSSVKKLPEKAVREKVVNQVNTKPIATVDSRSDTINPRGTITSTSGSKAQKSTESSTSTSNVKGGIKDRIIARPASSDLNRGKDDAQALAAAPNRPIPPLLNDPDGLSEGSMRVFGR